MNIRQNFMNLHELERTSATFPFTVEKRRGIMVLGIVQRKSEC